MMKVYTDENGVLRTEEVECSINGNEIVFVAENGAEYYLVVCSDSDSGFLSTIKKLIKKDGTGEDSECMMHWWILAAVILYLIALVLLRNKNKKVKLGLAAANTVVAVIVTIIGDCAYDKWFLLGSLLTSLPALNIIKSKDDEGVIESDSEIFQKAVYVLAGLGLLTLIVSTILSLSAKPAELSSEDNISIVEPISEEPVSEGPVNAVEEDLAEETPVEKMAEVAAEETEEETIEEVAQEATEEAAAEETVEENADEVVEEVADETVEETEEAADETADEVVEETVEETEEAVDEEASTDEDDVDDSNTGEIVAIEVEAGMDSRKIANLLEETGIIESAKEFDNFLCTNGYDVKMKVGHFDIPAGATEEEMAKILTKTN